MYGTIIRENPTQDYLDYLKRSIRCSTKTKLEQHHTELSRQTAFSYGLSQKQYDEVTVLLESEVI